MFLKKIIFCLFVLFFSACFDDKKEDTQDKTSNNEIFTLKNNDDKFDLNLLSGEKFSVNFINEKIKFNTKKAVLFVFFTTWCESCKAQFSTLNNLSQKYKGKVKIIGIVLEDKNKEELMNFVNKNNIVYEIANGENNYLLAKKLGNINAVPAMFLYNKNGKLFNEYLGIIPQEMLDIELQKVN